MSDPEDPPRPGRRRRRPPPAPPEASTRLGPPLPPEAAPEAPPSGHVGRFQLEDELGRGGMGVVYRAYDPALKRYVALKLVQRRFAGSAEVAQRFLSEAQVTAQLQHPAIVPLYEVGQTSEGDLYYTMRLVKGRTLTRVVQDELREGGGPDGEERFSRARVLHVFVQVCRAVAYAHARGVVHRDLKPENVMVGRFGQIYVMDWGVAKVMNESLRPARSPSAGPEGRVSAAPSATRVGSVVGTPAYMAPEQATGSPDAVGSAADVYSLGAILYFVLTGEPPHPGTSTEVLARVCQGVEPRPPSALRPDVPRALDELCLRAMRLLPEERLPGADALADALQEFLEGQPLQELHSPDEEGISSLGEIQVQPPMVMVELVVTARPDPARPTRVLLQRRQRPPFAGWWALPGDLLAVEESLVEAAHRVLRTRLGVGGVGCRQLGAWGEPDRDPRAHVVTVAFLVELPALRLPGAEASELAWLELHPDGRLELPGASAPVAVAFDHAEILAAAMERLRSPE